MISVLWFEDVFGVKGTHIRLFTSKSLAGLLTENGFRICDYGQYGRFKPVLVGMIIIAEKL